jgi:hypothetical protein
MKTSTFLFLTCHFRSLICDAQRATKGLGSRRYEHEFHSSGPWRAGRIGNTVLTKWDSALVCEHHMTGDVVQIEWTMTVLF